MEVKGMDNLPASPGCYIFKDDSGQIIYIGKSRNIKKRVAQYFTGKKNENDLKLRILVRQIKNVEYMDAETDIDAIFLEYKLIMQHRPPFNVKMSRDLRPNLLCININRERPGVYLRKAPFDGDICYRIYRRGWIGANLPKFFNDIFRTPVCGKRYFKEPFGQPCVKYRFGKCAAPCRRECDIDEYMRIINNLRSFFEGEDDSALDRLQTEMREMSENNNFEQAAVWRDQYNYLMNIKRYCQAGNFTFADKKVCVFAKSFHEEPFILCFVEDEQVKLQKRFISAEEFTKDEQAVYARRIYKKDLGTGGDTSVKALLEISAKRLFVDITETKSERDIACKLNKGFNKFYFIK